MRSELAIQTDLVLYVVSELAGYMHPGIYQTAAFMNAVRIYITYENPVGFHKL